MPVPVILDTDIGSDIDDTWALAFLLRCPELDVRLVTTDRGRPDYRARLACQVLAAGQRDVCRWVLDPSGRAIPGRGGRSRAPRATRCPVTQAR
jgi:hypothetical protein